MAKSLGTYKNAPLTYVLVAVNFDRNPDISTRLASSLEQVKNAGYPKYSPSTSTVFQLTPPNGVEPVDITEHVFTDADEYKSILLNDATFAFHVTKYLNYRDFAQQLSNAMSNFAPILNGVMVRRIGIRYVDIIIPAEGESPDEYVLPGLRSNLPLPFETSDRNGISIIDSAIGQGRIVIKYAVGTLSQVLPPDLQMNTLRPSDIFLKAQRAGGQIGIVDIDRFEGCEESFNQDALIARFNTLHDDQSKLFKALQTERAMNVWNSTRK